MYFHFNFAVYASLFSCSDLLFKMHSELMKEQTVIITIKVMSDNESPSRNISVPSKKKKKTERRINFFIELYYVHFRLETWLFP